MPFFYAKIFLWRLYQLHQIGSYPNPFSPLILSTNLPGQIPLPRWIIFPSQRQADARKDALSDSEKLINFNIPSQPIFSRKYALYTPELVEINLEYLSSKATELPEEIVKTASHNLTAAAKKYNITIPSNLEKYSSDTFTDNSIDLREIDETKYILKNASAPKTNYFALGSVKKYPIDTNMQIKKFLINNTVMFHNFFPINNIFLI